MSLPLDTQNLIYQQFGITTLTSFGSNILEYAPGGDGILRVDSGNPGFITDGDPSPLTVTISQVADATPSGAALMGVSAPGSDSFLILTSGGSTDVRALGQSGTITITGEATDGLVTTL